MVPTSIPRVPERVNGQGERVIVPGEYRVFVRGSQPGEIEGGVAGTFTVSGRRKRCRASVQHQTTLG